jgi:membrane protease YdiL (CAAX protease family)
VKTESIFIAEGKLRPIWRFVVSIPAVFIAVIVAETLAGFVAAGVGHRGAVFGAQLFVLLALLGAFKLLTNLLDQRPLGSVGLAFSGRWHLELSLGLGIGTVMMLAVGALEQFLGMARFTVNSAPAGQFLGWGVGLWFYISVAAADEELIFRGYPFQRLTEALGPVVAVALFSAAFGLVHLRNAGHTWLSTFNTMLVGVPLAVAYLRTRALWLPVGMHLAWNYVQGCGLGLPVSGIQMPFSFLRAEVTGSELLTGGSYGPEGGLLATAVIVAATVYLSLSRSIYISREMRALVFGPAPVAASAAEAVIPREVSTVQANADQPNLK